MRIFLDIVLRCIVSLRHNNDMPLNTALKIAIFETGLKQTVICHRADMTPWRLSRLLHGVTDATPDEKRKLAKVLKRRIAQIFPPTEERVAS